MCIFALIQKVQEEQQSSTLLKVKELFTDWIAEWRSLELGWPSLLCQSRIWAEVVGDTAVAVDEEEAEEAVFAMEEERRDDGEGMG